MTVSSSEIVSPNYPNPVSETNLDCVWTVKAQYGDGIVMRVLDVDMGAMCYANKLQVFIVYLSIILPISRHLVTFSRLMMPRRSRVRVISRVLE